MSALATYRQLLANHSLVRLLTGEFVSSIGDWLYLVALLIVVYRESNDPVVLGIVGAARVLPYVILSVPAGIVADRYDRRLVLLSTDVARGSIMVALTIIVLVDGPLWAIVALAILATCFSSFFGPAIGSYLPALVRDEHELGPANSAWASLDNLAFVVGPAIGGLIVAIADLALAFAINAVTFAVIAVILWSLPSSRAGTTPAPETAAPDRPAGPSATPAATAAPAFGAALRPVIRPLAGLSAIELASGFLLGGLGVLTVLLAVGQLHADEAATGYLNAAIGVGGLVGAVASGALVLRHDLGSPMLGGAIALAVGLAVLGASTTLPLALVAMVIASGGSLVAGVVGTTVFQWVVPDAIRGRALGGLMTLSTLAYAAGSLAIPVLVDRIGAFPTLAGGGIVVIGATAVALVLLGDARRRPSTPAIEALRRVARLPVLAGVAPAALEVAASRLASVPVAAGTTIIHEGEPADRFYIIDSGRFAVDQLDPSTGRTRRLRSLGPDDVFGELGLLRSAPRSATVTAETEGRLLALDGAAFLELVNAGPGLSVRLLELYRGGAVGQA